MRAATLRLWLVFTFAHLSLCDSTKSSCAGSHCDLCVIYARIYGNINLLAFSGFFVFSQLRSVKSMPMWCRLSSKLWQSCDLTNLNELKRTDSFIRKTFIYLLYTETVLFMRGEMQYTRTIGLFCII